MRRAARWIADRYRIAPGWARTATRIAFVTAVFGLIELAVPEWWDTVALLAFTLAVIAWGWWDRMPRWVRAVIVVVEVAVAASVAAVYVPPPVWAAILGVLTFMWAADIMGFPVIPRRWRRRATPKAPGPTFTQAASVLSLANEAINGAERLDPQPGDDDPEEWAEQADRLEQFAWHLRARGMLGTARTAYDLAARARAIAERLTDDDADDPTPPTVPAGDGPPPASPPTR